MKQRWQWLVVTAAFVLLASGCAVQQSPKPCEVAEAQQSQEETTTDMEEQEMASYDQEQMEETTTEEAAPAPEPEQQQLEMIHFEFDQYVLTPEARRTLEENAEYMKNHPDQIYVLEGHCDERGSDEYNLALGQRRAKSARDYLVSLGVDKKRLGIISYGEEQPLVEGHNKQAWAKNRRVEFELQ